jgi:hypothetical protein
MSDENNWEVRKMKLTQEQKVQLLSEPGMLAIGDFLAVESRTKENNTYWTASVVVGNSTLKFEIEPLEAGQLKTIARYTKVYVHFSEFTFQKSGMTIKRALKITVDAQ